MMARFWSLIAWMPPKARHYIFLVPIALLVTAAVVIERASDRASTFSSRGRLAFAGRINFSEGNPVNSDAMALFGTQLELMTGEDLRERAMIRLRVEIPAATERPRLDARVVPRTTIFELTATADKPAYVQRYLDLLMEEFIGMRREQRLISSRSVMDQISAEIARLDTLLSQQETELYNFKQQRNIVFWEQQSNTAARFLSQLKNREAQLRMELKMAEVSRPESERSAATRSLFSPDASERTEGVAARPGSGAASDYAASHRQKLRELEAELEDARRTFLPKHPTYQKLELDISREKRLLALVERDAAEAAKAQTLALQGELATLQTSMGEWEQKALESGRIMAEHQKLENAVSRTRELYQRMVASLQNIDFRKGVDDDMVQILQRAGKSVENKPSLAGPLRDGLFLGAILGLGLVWLAQKIDRRAFSSKEIADRLEREVLVEVPKIPAKHLQGVSYLQPDCPPSFVEAIRGLRGSLVLTAAQREAKVVLVTSTTAAEGKSTLSLNLAQATAESGLKTLLIDADLRRGTLAHRLGIAADTPGLADIIRGEKSWRDCLIAGQQHAFTCIIGGNRPSTVVDRLLREFPHEMLEKARHEYDLIIFDAPPLMPVRDADTMLTFADRVVFVVKLRGAALDAAERSLRVVKRLAKAEPLLVVNQVNASDGHGYYYYSSYGPAS